MAPENSFWPRVCGALFVKSPRWQSITRSLPDKLDLGIALKRTIGPETLTQMGIRAQGWVGSGIQTVVKPNPICPDDFPLSQLQWAYLQFASQFFIMEGMFNFLAAQAITEPELWPKGVLEELIELTQTMVFYAAMLIIAEENRLPDHEADIEPPVREEVRKITVTLANKTADYGQAFLRHGIIGMLYRVWDKIARYATLAAESRDTKFESIKDTSMDMLGYSVLIWSILEDIKASTPTAENPITVANLTE